MPPSWGFVLTRKPSTGWYKVPPVVPLSPDVPASTRVSARMNPPWPPRDSPAYVPTAGTMYSHRDCHNQAVSVGAHGGQKWAEALYHLASLRPAGLGCLDLAQAPCSGVLCCQITPGGGIKRRDNEIRQQPSGDPSNGENPSILLFSVSRRFIPPRLSDSTVAVHLMSVLVCANM